MVTAGCDTCTSSVCPLSASHGPSPLLVRLYQRFMQSRFSRISLFDLARRIHDSKNMHEMRYRCATELQLRLSNRACRVHREPGVRSLIRRGRAFPHECSIFVRFQAQATTVLPCDYLVPPSRDRMRRSLFPAVVIMVWLDGTHVFWSGVRSPRVLSPRCFYPLLTLSLLPVLTLSYPSDAAGSKRRYKV